MLERVLETKLCDYLIEEKGFPKESLVLTGGMSVKTKEENLKLFSEARSLRGSMRSIPYKKTSNLVDSRQTHR